MEQNVITFAIAFTQYKRPLNSGKGKMEHTEIGSFDSEGNVSVSILVHCGKQM